MTVLLYFYPHLRSLTPLPPSSWMIDSISGKEEGVQRSLMHRYNTAADLVSESQAAASPGEKNAALAAVTVWLR